MTGISTSCTEIAGGLPTKTQAADAPSHQDQACCNHVSDASDIKTVHMAPSYTGPPTPEKIELAARRARAGSPLRRSPSRALEYSSDDDGVGEGGLGCSDSAAPSSSCAEATEASSSPASRADHENWVLQEREEPLLTENSNRYSLFPIQ